MNELQTEQTRPIETPASEIDEPLEMQPIETPTSEIDEPPAQPLGHTQKMQIPLKEQQRWMKWLKNFDFIKYTLSLMIFVYIIDLIVSIILFKKNSSLAEPLFEILKTILLTVAGYVFGKSQDD